MIRPDAPRKPATFQRACPNSMRWMYLLSAYPKTVLKNIKVQGKNGLNFPLLSDENGELCDDYGTWVEKSMYGRKYMGIDRATFVIDAERIISAAWRKVKITGHIEEVLNSKNQ